MYGDFEGGGSSGPKRRLDGLVLDRCLFSRFPSFVVFLLPLVVGRDLCARGLDREEDWEEDS